jgi:hypothetical protein
MGIEQDTTMNAYLLGVAAAQRPEPLVNPYEESTEEHKAWWNGVSDTLDAIESGE